MLQQILCSQYFYTLFCFLNKTVGWPRVPRTSWTHGESHSIEATMQLSVKRSHMYFCSVWFLIFTKWTCFFFRVQLDQLDIKGNMASQGAQWVSVNHSTQQQCAQQPKHLLETIINSQYMLVVEKTGWRHKRLQRKAWSGFWTANLCHTELHAGLWSHHWA